MNRVEIALFLSLLVGSCSAANIVSNGDFEAAATDWSGSMSIGVFGYEHSGTQSAVTGCVGHSCVDTLGVGAYFGQALSTVAGQSYDLSFWVGENSGPTSEFSIFWDRALVADVSNFANNSLPGFIQYSLIGLVANGTSTALEIHGRQDPAGIYFDDISVDASGQTAPEPATFGLIGVAVLVAGIRRRTSRA
jgi:hypothetical protein